MSVSRDKKTGYYQYNFMFKGVRYHRRFKDASFDDVVGFETIAKSELRKSGYDITSDNYSCSLSEIVHDYKQYALNNYTRPKEAILIAERFLKITGNKPAEQVVLNDLEKYRSSRVGIIKASSINRETDNIRRIFSLAKSNKKIRFNPCDDLKDLRIENPRKRFLEKEEEELLLPAASPILQAIIIIAIDSGMRSGELKNLKWQDVFLKHDYLIALNTKNGRARKILITPRMKKELEKLPKISEYVFTNPVTKAPYKDFKTSFSRAVKRAGIPHITFHELRHTTASRLNEKGVDLSTIQEYLDHADSRTTQQYIHNPRKNILDAVRVLSEY